MEIRDTHSADIYCPCNNNLHMDAAAKVSVLVYISKRTRNKKFWEGQIA
jgi:hypothetical protein